MGCWFFFGMLEHFFQILTLVFFLSSEIIWSARGLDNIYQRALLHHTAMNFLSVFAGNILCRWRPHVFSHESFVKSWRIAFSDWSTVFCTIFDTLFFCYYCIDQFRLFFRLIKEFINKLLLSHKRILTSQQTVKFILLLVQEFLHFFIW